MLDTCRAVADTFGCPRSEAMYACVVMLVSSTLPESHVMDLVDRAEQMIFDVSQNNIEGRFVPLKDIIHTSIETIDKLYQRKEHVTGVASGFHEFDTKTAGLQPSDLIIVDRGIAARGRTAPSTS